MTKVNVDEVRRIKARRAEINHIPFEKIEWVDDNGNPVEVDPEWKAEWPFTGLCNCDFVDTAIFGEKRVIIMHGYKLKDGEDVPKHNWS